MRAGAQERKRSRHRQGLKSNKSARFRLRTAPPWHRFRDRLSVILDACRRSPTPRAVGARGLARRTHARRRPVRGGRPPLDSIQNEQGVSRITDGASKIASEVGPPGVGPPGGGERRSGASGAARRAVFSRPAAAASHATRAAAAKPRRRQAGAVPRRRTRLAARGRLGARGGKALPERGLRREFESSPPRQAGVNSPSASASPCHASSTSTLTSMVWRPPPMNTPWIGQTSW